MLAEELEYEELSFVKRPADKFGKVKFIHDNEEQEYEQEYIQMEADVDIILAKDFFKLADGKKIICMDNICKVINQPEGKMNKKKEGQKTINVSYVDEFNAEELKGVKLTDSEDESNLEEILKLSDEVMGELTNRDFAIIQKTSDGVKRRFPIHTAENIKAAVQLINIASDITESEKEKAISSIGRVAKKAGIEFKITDEEVTTDPIVPETEEVTVDPVVETETDPVVETEVVVEEKTIEALCDELKVFLEAVDETKLQDDDKKNPLGEIFNMLVSFAGNLKWAGECLNNHVGGYLTDCGKEAIEKGIFDSLTTEVTVLKDSMVEREEEIALLEDQNMELNYTMRSSLVDEIIEYKTTLTLIDAKNTSEKEELIRLPYDALVKQKNEFKQLVSKTVNNTVTKEITSIKDPTLLNDSDESVTDDITDPVSIKDNITVPTDAEFIKGLKNLLKLG